MPGGEYWGWLAVYCGLSGILVGVMLGVLMVFSFYSGDGHNEE